MNRNFLRSNINGFIALVCVGCVALSAWLIIWQSAFGENPVANAMAAQLSAEKQSY